jgi:hypothetical protein
VRGNESSAPFGVAVDPGQSPRRSFISRSFSIASLASVLDEERTPLRVNSKHRALIASLLTVCAVTSLAACGNSSQGSAAPQVSTKHLVPANFDDPATGRNPYLPLVPGTQTVREGTTEVGGRAVPHQVTTTVTDAYRTVHGIRTVLSLDHEVDGGQVSQISIDYLAEDKAGNVWNLGGYTQEYEGGRLVGGVDPWLTGVNGAKAGILVQAHPSVDTPVYSVDKPDREESSVAEVIDVGVRHCVPFDCFKDVLIVREGKKSAPDNEFKYYARDVGQIDNVPRGDSVHQDVEKMVNYTKLSPQALAEFTQEALRIDHNAPKQAPRVFGGLPVAQRG